MCKRRLKFILILLVLAISSCHNLRLFESNEETGDYEVNAVKLVEKVRNNNIITKPLVVNKINVSYKQGREKRRFKANLKYNGNDSILLSLRTFAGIEAARVLIDKDTVKIRDRFNKICYIGKTKELERKYGIEYELINLLFGDIDDIKPAQKRIKCEDRKVMLTKKNPDWEIDYTIDCKINKIIKVERKKGFWEDEIEGNFSEFVTENGLLYPGKINWKLNNGETTLDIEMENIKRVESTNLIFRIGNDYKIRFIR